MGLAVPIRCGWGEVLRVWWKRGWFSVKGADLVWMWDAGLARSGANCACDERACTTDQRGIGYLYFLYAPTSGAEINPHAFRARNPDN